MKNISISERTIDSCKIASCILGSISIFSTISGYSLKDIMPASTFCARSAVVAAVFVILAACIYRYIRKDYVTLRLRHNNVKIYLGNIFEAEGYKVIACDTKFSTEADDKIISKNSIHGQFLLQHAVISEVKQRVNDASGGSSGNFEAGKIIDYHSSIDDETYLLLAFTKLNEHNESHTNTAEFVQTLMCMWKEINSVYNGHAVVLPLLGTGITRFDDGSKDNQELLACMLYTLYFSGLKFKRQIQIIMKESDIPLYEYKNILARISREER